MAHTNPTPPDALYIWAGFSLFTLELDGASNLHGNSPLHHSHNSNPSPSSIRLNLVQCFKQCSWKLCFHIAMISNKFPRQCDILPIPINFIDDLKSEMVYGLCDELLSGQP